MVFDIAFVPIVIGFLLAIAGLVAYGVDRWQRRRKQHESHLAIAHDAPSSSVETTRSRLFMAVLSLHSALSAMTGSTDDARRAGIPHASAAVENSAHTTPTSAIGSSGPMPNRAL